MSKPQRMGAVLDALLSTPTIDAAARAANVSRSTVERYMQNAEFHAEFVRRRDDVMQNVCDHMRQEMTNAVSVVAAIMKDEETPKPVRITAARTVLEYGVKLAELADLIKRVQALEDAQKGERIQ